MDRFHLFFPTELITIVNLFKIPAVTGEIFCPRLSSLKKSDAGKMIHALFFDVHLPYPDLATPPAKKPRNETPKSRGAEAIELVKPC